MAIKIGRKQIVSAKKEFTDRDEPRKNFWKRFYTMKNNGSTIITYYGTGGVGKTSLMKKLQENIAGFSEEKDIAFVRVDFQDKPTTLSILQKMRRELEVYGCNFPMFYTGEFSYFLKTGQKSELDAPKIESAINNNKWLSQVKKNWTKPIAIIDFFLPGVNAVATGISIIGNALIKYWEDEEILDDEHREIKARLDELQSDDTNPYEVYELLPELFAQDVNDWLNSDKSEKNYLVVFLDTYEALTNEESSTSGQLNAESWLRSETGNPTGIIFLLANTLWVIAGRNELHWEGSLTDELEQHKLEPLAQYDADRFLQTAGVTSQELRDYIYNLTKGLPYFLDLCVDLYATHKRDHNGAEPDISIFPKKRKDVVERFFQYMDDGTRDMIKFLCGLVRWTDEIAFEIGTKTFNFSQTTYERIKELSFIKSEDIVIDDMRVENFSATVFSLDRTVQTILFPSCAKNVIEKTFTVADEYFSKVLKESKVNGEYLFNLEYWAKLTACLTTSPDDLRNHCEENFEVNWILLMENLCWFDIAENILKIFVNEFTDDAGKFKNFQDSVAFAYFEGIFGYLKQSQGFYQDAYNYHNSAYEKCSRLLGDEHPDTIDAINNLALTLNKLGHYDEALELQEKVLQLCKKNLGDEHSDTIAAIHNLALTLSDLGRYNEALELQNQSLALHKKIFGEEHSHTIDAMHPLALTLWYLGRYDEALELQQQTLSLDKKILGEEHPATINAMNNLATTLQYLGRYDEALEFQNQVLALYKKILGDEHPQTIVAMNNLATTLQCLGRYDEALELQNQALSLYKKILGEEHPATINAMDNLATTLQYLGRYDEAFGLQNQALPLNKKILGDEHPQTIAATNNLALTLKYLKRYDEALELQEQVLHLNKKILGDEHPQTIVAMRNFAFTLNDLGRYDEALELQNQALALYKKILGDEHHNTINAMNNLATTLTDLGRYDQALELKMKVLALCKKILGDEHPDTIAATNNLALTLNDLGRYDEALELQNQALSLYKKILGDEHPDTIAATNNLALTLQYLGRYDEALELQQQALSLRQKNLGEDDETTIYAMDDLALTLTILERYEEALKLQEEILSFCKEHLGDEHYNTIGAMNNLALTLNQLGRKDEAKNFIQQAKNLIAKVDTADAELVAKFEDSYKTIFNS